MNLHFGISASQVSKARPGAPSISASQAKIPICGSMHRTPTGCEPLISAVSQGCPALRCAQSQSWLGLLAHRPVGARAEDRKRGIRIARQCQQPLCWFLQIRKNVPPRIAMFCGGWDVGVGQLLRRARRYRAGCRPPSLRWLHPGGPRDRRAGYCRGRPRGRPDGQ